MNSDETNLKDVAKKPIFKKWWFWVGVSVVIIIGLGSNKTSVGTGSVAQTDSAAIANISNTHKVFTERSFSVIRQNGITDVSGVWSTNDPIGNELYDAMHENKKVAFIGKVSSVGLSYLRYNYIFVNNNCTTSPERNNWIEIKPEVSDKVQKQAGSHEIMITGTIKKIEANGSKSACDNGKISITMSVDDIYDMVTKKAL